MNVKRFLSDSFRRQIDNRINRLVVNHKINQTREGARTQYMESRPTIAPITQPNQRVPTKVRIATVNSPRPSAPISVNPVPIKTQMAPSAITRKKRIQKSSLSSFPSEKNNLAISTNSFSNITSEHASAVYIKKCEDLGLLPNPTAEKRFIEQFINSINEKSLRFTGLGLGPQSINCIVELFYTNPQLVYIDLSLNRLGDEGARTIGQYLELNTPMIYIDLRSNGIGIQGCVELFKGLKQNYHITNLDLSAVDGIERNRIGTEGCKYLGDVLSVNETLSNLNASMCGITADGCRFLGPALALNQSLMILDLTANRFGSVGANNLFSIDDSFGQLTTLILARNGIGDDAAKAICRQLARSKTINNIDLSDNNLGKKFLRHFYDALQLHQLTTINLSKNKIGADCADFLHIIIRDFPSMRNINISSNQLKDSTIMQIADALKQNNTIQSIDLSDTIMGDDSASSLAAVIREHTSLQKLLLAGNRITDEGGVLIAKALTTNTSLVVLSMKNNELKDETANAFLEALTKNTTISDLDVSYNDFSYRSYVKLTQTIEEHKHTLNSNIAEIATKHIDWLKSEEQRLFKYREEIAEQIEIVENTTGERNLKQEELRNLIRMKTDETNKIQKELDDIKADYDQIADERRGKQQEFNDIKMNYEGKHSHLQTQLTSLSQKRQHAQTRLLKSEKARKDQAAENEKLMAELKGKLNDAREQLKAAINVALDTKKSMLEEEQRQEEEKRLAEIAQKKAAKKKNSKKKKKNEKPQQPRAFAALDRAAAAALAQNPA
ncbi:hypothetical protein M9Y10_029276 [Tritrichomonas musculus]|uniref:Leucine Rich Repeat family protein n=1 Tax=Tritrichomonas musculus TaxID=1915356 RepID=A0ABR2KLT9_9EUKA